MLVVIGGLPGSGKSTIAQIVSRQCNGVYLRIDTIEQALRSASVLQDDVGPAGYLVAYALAETNLKLGRNVIADSVNPISITRAAWRSVAAATAAPVIEVEIICSDAIEHRRRVETRAIDIAGLVPPTWAAVLAREYEAWPEARLVIDTAFVTAVDAASMIIAASAESSSQQAIS